MFSVPPLAKLPGPVEAPDGDAPPLFPLFDELEHAVTSSPIAEIAASSRTDPLIPIPPVARRRPPSPHRPRREPFVAVVSSPSSVLGYVSATPVDRARRAGRRPPG